MDIIRFQNKVSAVHWNVQETCFIFTLSASLTPEEKAYMRMFFADHSCISIENWLKTEVKIHLRYPAYFLHDYNLKLIRELLQQPRRPIINSNVVIFPRCRVLHFSRQDAL